MRSEPSSPGFIDPNARLLASVIPPPPPTLGAKVARFITARSPGSLQRIVRWSGSREGRSCFFAALAGVALTLAFYRSESSSAASAVPHAEPPSAPLAAGASVRSAPLALTPTSKSAPTGSAGPSEVTATTARDTIDDAPAGDNLADDNSAEGAALALGDARRPSDALRPAPRKAAGAKSKAKGKKFAKSRKAKRHALARASSRSGRRAKSQRAKAAGPLAAWLATQRSKESAASKRR